MIVAPDHVWCDGKLMEADESRVGLLTHSLHYAYAAIDGLRSYRQDDGGVAMFRAHDHLRRLRSSAEALGLAVSYEHDTLVEATAEVIRANGLSDAYIRPLVFVGEPNIIFAHWLNEVHVALVPFAWSGYSDRDADAGTVAKVSPYRRASIHAPLYKAKVSGHYMLNVLAFGEARAAGVAQALFVDDQGYVCEGTGENLFALHGDTLSTPPTTRALLPGMTRDTVMVLARELGLTVVERDLVVDDLTSADEIFTTGTASGVLGIPELDGKRISDGAGPTTRALRERYVDIVRGRVPEHADWLTAV